MSTEPKKPLMPEVTRMQLRHALADASDMIALARMDIEDSDLANALENLDLASNQIGLVHQRLLENYDPETNPK